MNELDDLKAEAAKTLAEFKAHGEKISAEGYEASEDEKVHFTLLENTVKEKQTAILELQKKSESASERDDRLNRMKGLGELQTKINDFNFRRPNDEADFARADQDDDLGRAMSAWGRFGCSNADLTATMEEVQAGKRLGVNIASSEFRVTNADLLRANARHIRAIYAQAARDGLSAARVQLDDYRSSETDALDSRIPERAGYLNRAPEFLNTLEMNMIAYGGILQAPVTIMVTDHYEDVIETYGDDTTHSGRQIGESQTIGTTLTPNFANLVWKAYDFTSDDIPVFNRQLERSRFGLPTYIAQMLGERLGRVTGTKCTTGTGAVTPYGIKTQVTAMGTSMTTAVSLVIGYNDVVDLECVLDPIYWRVAPEIGFMMHPKVLPLLRKIKDGIGRPIFEIGQEQAARTYSTLNGRRIYWNNDLTAPISGAFSSGDKAMIYGDFSRFVIRRAGGGMPVLIRDETTNRRTLGTIFTALTNFDSRVRNYGAVPLAEMRIL